MHIDADMSIEERHQLIRELVGDLPIMMNMKISIKNGMPVAEARNNKKAIHAICERNHITGSLG